MAFILDVNVYYIYCCEGVPALPSVRLINTRRTRVPHLDAIRVDILVLGGGNAMTNRTR